MRRVLIIAALILAQAAQAQIAVPPVRLPRLPDALTPELGTDLSQATRNLDVQVRTDLRRLRIRELLRTQSRLVEADPDGAPIVRGELLAFSPSEAAVQQARAAGFEVLREEALDGLDARIVVFRPPQRTQTRRALRQLRSLDPAGGYDFNHLYFDSGAPTAIPEAHGELQGEAPAHGEAPAPARVEAIPQSADVAQASGKVGLIDGGVDAEHPVFRAGTIHRHGCAGVAVGSDHGTAVASLLVGASAHFRGAAPGTELFSADVYCGKPAGGAVDAVVDAFAWLVSERVGVINVSLVGPPNAMLEAIVRRVVERGYLIVAAVGNDGPAAPPLYPAAYPDVIGVTAVDAHGRVLIEAERGPQVKFAAPGADMAAARPPHGYVEVRGTSFASPIVAGMLAMQLRAPDRDAARDAVAGLIRGATDLGAPGPDKVYGNGLVGGALRCALAQANLDAH